MRGASDLEELRARLGIAMTDAPRLEEALVHGSVNQTGGPAVPTNARLAFLGDAVIELAIRHDRFNTDGAASIGELSIKADEAVRNRRLAEIARSVSLGRYIDLGKGARAESDRESVLATAFEAVIGAIFVEKGFPTASCCALRIINA
jgi:ribonuclease III